MNWRKFLVAIGAGILTLIVAVGIMMMMKNAKKPPEQKHIPKTIRKVQSERVHYHDRSSTVRATGRVLSQQAVEVIAEVQGKLLPGDVPLKEGQTFQKGTVLANIYSNDTKYALQARKSAYLNTLASILPDLKIDYPDDYDLWVAFFDQIDIEKSLPELPQISSQLKIFLASRGVLTEYYGIKSDEERLKKYTLYAPYNGAIQSVLLQTGSVVNPGSRVAQIIKTSALEIEVPVEAQSAAWIRKGNIAKVFSETGEELGSARVQRIAEYIDPQTQSINIYLNILNSGYGIRAGAYVQVEFSDIHIARAMELPRNAVFNRNQVFTIDSGYLKKQEITILKLGANTVLFNGPEEGTEVVAEPLANAHEKMQVQSDYTKPPVPDTLSGSSSHPNQDQPADKPKL